MFDLVLANVVVVAGLLGLVFTSGRVVRTVLSLESERDFRAELGDEVVDTGMIIGKAENVLIYILVLAQAYTALALVFAAKSIVRREDMGSGDSLYYLAGTMVNFTYSLAVAFVVLNLLRLL